jgi:hypothetical protein
MRLPWEVKFLFLETLPHQRNDWKLLKEEFFNKFGPEDQNEITRLDASKGVFYYREWTINEADRHIVLRLYTKKSTTDALQVEHEYAHVLVRKLTVPLMPELTYP